MTNWKHIRMGQALRFNYTNHRGVTEQREVAFGAIQYGSNDYYPEPQWFLYCYDRSRGAMRSFALNRIDPNELELVGDPPPLPPV